MNQGQQRSGPSLDPQKQGYLKEMEEEKTKLSAAVYPHASRLLGEEIDRVQTGRDLNKLVEVHQAKPTKVSVKVLIPVKQYPKYNFVGKLLGPKGATLKSLQDETGTKMAILGRGSMRERSKEEECRKEGGKYAHLNDDLHIQVEAYAPVGEAHSRLAHALSELSRYMIPELGDPTGQPMDHDMGMHMNGDKPGGPPGGPPPPPGFRGRGRGRGGPPPPVGRGHAPPGGPGGPGGLLSTPGPRNAPPGPPPPAGPARGLGRAAPAPRGRAAPPPSLPPPRPAPGPGRSAPPPSRPPPSAYEQDSYGYPQGSSSSYGQERSYDRSYDRVDDYPADPYSSSYPSAHRETEYFDYGHGAAAEDSYRDYGGDSWGQSSTYGKAPAPRSRNPAPERSHPYGSSSASRSSRY